MTALHPSIPPIFAALDGHRFTGKSGMRYMLRAGCYSTGNGAFMVECESGEAECVLSINLSFGDEPPELGPDEFCVRLQTMECSEAPAALLEARIFEDTGRLILGPHGQRYARIWRFVAKESGNALHHS